MLVIDALVALLVLYLFGDDGFHAIAAMGFITLFRITPKIDKIFRMINVEYVDKEEK